MIQLFLVTEKEFSFFWNDVFLGFFCGFPGEWEEGIFQCSSFRNVIDFEWVRDRSAPTIGVAAVIRPTFSSQNVLVAGIVEQPEAEHDWLKQLDKMCCVHHTICARDSKRVG